MTRHRRLHALHGIAFMSFLFSTLFAYADGLGPIQLLSGLGQPLRANISFSNNGDAELGSACISAKLALMDGTFLTTPRISLARNKRTSTVYISTTQNINEPAVLLNVEIGCGTTTQRNYQLLLDPANIDVASSLADARSTVVHTQTQIQSQGSHQESRVAVPSAKPLAYHPNRSDAQKIDQGDSSKVVRGATLIKEMELPVRSSTQIVQNSATSPSNIPTWSSDAGDVLFLKTSDNLAEPGSADDSQRNEEFRVEQLRFAAIINNGNATQSAEAATKAEQEKIQLLQAENERNMEQARIEKLAQDEKRKELRSIARAIGIGALLLACLAAIIWFVSKFLRPKRPKTTHRWKNYQTASDTLIADLSTQTLLDSEFLTTVGEHYNTTVFSDTQFEPDTIIDYGFVEESPDDTDEFANSMPIDVKPAAISTESPIRKSNAVEMPPASDTPIPPLSASQAPVKSEVTATPATQTANDSVPATPAVVKPNPAITEAGKAPPANTQAETRQALQPTQTKPVAVNGQANVPKGVSPTLVIKEIADLMQQAEFWMLLQDPFRAIEILEPYRDEVHPESPVPWIYLLDLYRMVGDKKKYEALIARIENIFNAKIPKWDGQFGITPRSLNDFPHVVEKICDLWETNEIEPYLEGLLRDNRDGARQGFDLPVYRNIIQLITLAREPKESKQQEQMRFEKAQAILFSQQIPQLNEIASAVEIQSSKTTAAEKEGDAVTTQNNVAPVTHDKTIGGDKTDTVKTDATHAAISRVDTKLGAKTIPDHKKSHTENVKTANDFLKDPRDSEARNEIVVADEDEVEHTSASSMETKLELAKVYQEIGEKDGARELLYEVIKDGSPDQSDKAKAILKGIH